MTVCIAAKCWSRNNAPIIVTASDQMLTYGYLQADGSIVKKESLGFGWSAMFAGDDISPAGPIMSRARRLIGIDNSPSLQDVQRAIVTAYQEERGVFAEQSVLSKWRISFDEFKLQGRSKLGESYERVATLFEESALSVEFLVYGLLKRRTPAMFIVSNPGVVQTESYVPWSVIGKGAWAARPALTSYTDEAPIEEAIYRVCEAKFLAEADNSVGKETTVTWLEHNGFERTLRAEDVAKIRSAWEDHRKRGPDVTRETIAKALDDAPTIEEYFERLQAELKNILGKQSPQS